MSEDYFISTESLKAIAELAKWAEDMPDLTKYGCVSVRPSVMLDGEQTVHLTADGVNIEHH